MGTERVGGERANVSVKTIKRLEATNGRVEAHSEWTVKKALELGGIEFVGDHDWRDRTDGVRFCKDPTGKIRREVVNDAKTWLDVTFEIEDRERPRFF